MLDYTTREKRCLPVKLINGKTVLLTAPRKALYSQLTALKGKLESREEESDVNQMYDEILQITANILSTNKSGVTFTVEDVDAIMDIEDMALLISEYSKYAGQVVGNPN